MDRAMNASAEVNVALGWPFVEPENLAVITTKQIVSGDHPILHVVHNNDDEGWQFLGPVTPREDDAAVVALRTIVRVDETVGMLADLPPGWRAWRRSPDEPWRRAEIAG